MANSYVQYPGDGQTRVFAVPFKYLDRSHIKVTIDGVNRAFDWLSSNSIRLGFAPAEGKTLTIRRYTPNNKPLVDFQDGSTITEKDLDKLAYQNVFLNQEAVDLYETVSGTAEGLVGLVQEALNSAATTEAQAAEALEKATNAENTVLDTGAQVNLDRVAVETARDVTLTSTAAGQIAANTAVSNAAITTTKAAEALASANAAAASAAIAEAAAGFNPSDFYTAIQIDGLLNETVFQLSQIEGLDTAIAGKADAVHTHPVSQISGLQTVLDAKLGSTATAAAAQKWSASRTISFTGGVTGTFTIDGSANASAALTVTANSHAHTIANVTGLQDALDGKAPTAHTHTIANVTGLQSAIDAKQSASARLNAIAAMATPATANILCIESDGTIGQVTTSATARDLLALGPGGIRNTLSIGQGDTVTFGSRVHTGNDTNNYNFNNNNSDCAFLSNGGTSRFSSTGGTPMQLQRTSNNGEILGFFRGTTQVGSINVTTTGTTYVQTSDQRLKEDYQPIDPAILDAIKVYDFRWKADGSRGYGVKAQELYTLVPTAAVPGELDEESGVESPWGVDYSRLVPLLIAKVQQLDAKLKALETDD